MDKHVFSGPSYLVLNDAKVCVSIGGELIYSTIRKGDILRRLDGEIAQRYIRVETYAAIANLARLDFDSSIEIKVPQGYHHDKSFSNNIRVFKYPELELPFEFLPTYLNKPGLDQDLILWRLSKGC